MKPHPNWSDEVKTILQNLWSLYETYSVTTKYCFISALLYVILPTDSTYILIAGLLITMKAGPLFAVPVDVFQPVEEILSPLVFGLKEKPIEKQE